jgi:uncharacterized OB-fold protein
MTAVAIDLPEPSVLLAAHRQALAEGRLTFQRCSRCGHAWLPPRDFCPNCLHSEWDWNEAAGRARVISWVVYHRAYHDAFAHRVPYNVVLAELDEGPRMISNVEPLDKVQGISVDAPLEVVFGTEGEVPVARFRLAA